MEVEELDKKNRGNTLEVTPISPQGFAKYERSLDDNTIEFNESGWVEVNADQPIKNMGASICLIIYVYNRKEDKMISGHFSITRHEIGKEWWQIFLRKSQEKLTRESPPDKIEIFTPKDLEKATPSQVRIYEKYRSLLARLEELAARIGGENLEVVLFGQNFPLPPTLDKSKAKVLAKMILKQFNVMEDLKAVGIPTDNVADHRTQFVDKIDDTLYLPEEKKILHASIDVTGAQQR